jgi:hypothetical protein
MKRILPILLLLWELPQNLLGAAVLAVLALGGRVRRIEAGKGRLFVRVNGPSVSLGLFIFWAADREPDRPPPERSPIRSHEYGHSFQSRWLGPLYLPAVGLPSVARVAYGGFYRRKHGRPWPGYYRGYPEDWADRLGRRYG